MTSGDIDLKQLQKALRELRESRHPDESVRQFAKNAGISASHIALMEGRKKKSDLKKANESSPTIFMLNRFLRHCGKSLTQFFSEFERSKPKDLSPDQADLLDTVTTLITSNEEVEHRVRERIGDVQAWIAMSQFHPESIPRGSPRPASGREKDLKEGKEPGRLRRKTGTGI